MIELAPDSNGSRIDTPIEYLPAGALHAGLHDPGARPGDGHPALVGQGPGQAPGQVVQRIVGARSRRAEDRHLAAVLVRANMA